MKILLVAFSDNSDHQDTLFGLYEHISVIYDTYLLAIKNPKVPVPFIDSDHTWLIDCPKRPGITLKTFDIVTLASIIRRIRNERFDIVFFESLHVWNIPIMLTVAAQTHTYQMIHDVIPHAGDKQVKGVIFMNGVVCKLADTIVLCSQRYVDEIINRYKIAPSRVKVIDLWRRYPSYHKPVYSKRVLFFGRINPYKGVDNLLEIVRLCPQIHFDVIGRVAPQMKYVVAELSKEKNVFLNNDYVSDEEMKHSFINCDCVIVPYNSATQSGIIIDAYKYARPVIAFNVGGISGQIEDGKSGFLIDAGDNKAFAAKIKEVLSMTRETYDSLCQYAYQYGCENFSAANAARCFCKMITNREK